MNSKDFLKAGKAVFIKLGLIATTLGSAQASIIDNVATYTYTETQMVLLDGIDGCQNSQGCSRTYTTEAATGDLSLFTGGIASYYSDYQINPSLNALDGYQVTENVNISYLTNDSQDWDNAFGSSAKGQANSFVNNNGENVPFTYSDSNTVAATTASSALSVSLMAYQWRVNSTGNLDSVDMDISYLMWVEGWAEMFDEVTGGGEFSAESFMAIYDSEGNEVLADSLDISGYVDGASGRDSDFVPREWTRESVTKSVNVNETYTVVLKTITETNAFERDMDMRARAYSDPVIKFNASVDPVADGLSYEEARASNVNVISPVSVPEPGTLFVFSLGILGLIIRRAF